MSEQEQELSTEEEKVQTLYDEFPEVRKEFEGITALKGVSVKFPLSGITAIIGPNGSGKTTLLNVLTGYLRPAGEVLMGEIPGFTVQPGECARIGTGGMLPDGTDAVVMVEHTRVLDDAPSPLREEGDYYGGRKAWQTERVAAGRRARNLQG